MFETKIFSLNEAVAHYSIKEFKHIISTEICLTIDFWGISIIGGKQTNSQARGQPNGVEITFRCTLVSLFAC